MTWAGDSWSPEGLDEEGIRSTLRSQIGEFNSKISSKPISEEFVPALTTPKPPVKTAFNSGPAVKTAAGSGLAGQTPAGTADCPPHTNYDNNHNNQPGFNMPCDDPQHWTFPLGHALTAAEQATNTNLLTARTKAKQAAAKAAKANPPPNPPPPQVRPGDAPSDSVDPDGVDQPKPAGPPQPLGKLNLLFDLPSHCPQAAAQTGEIGLRPLWQRPTCFRGGHNIKDNVVATRGTKDKATIQVTPDQAAKIRTFLDNASKNAPNYNLYHSNCAQFCERALQAGGVKNVPNDLTPHGLVEDLKGTPHWTD